MSPPPGQVAVEAEVVVVVTVVEARGVACGVGLREGARPVGTTSGTVLREVSRSTVDGVARRGGSMMAARVAGDPSVAAEAGVRGLMSYTS